MDLHGETSLWGAQPVPTGVWRLASSVSFMDRTERFAWLAVGWSVTTILLGAVVRATHSGAGCGRTWPTCQGQLLPELAGATSIEFTHRMASAVALLVVAVLVGLVHRRRPKAHPARRAVIWAGIAVLAEAMIGALIVLYEGVEADASVARAISVPLHLANTLALLAALTLTAWFLAGGGRLQLKGNVRRWMLAGGIGLVAIAITGAVTALADTLFPSASIIEAVSADFSATEHFLTRLRIIHPLLALAVVIVGFAVGRGREAPQRSVRRLALLTLLQLGIGVANIVLGTPLWLQLVHLAVANVIWISYVWLTAQVLSSDEVSAATDLTGAWQTNPLQR
jgi:heme A synthase